MGGIIENVRDVRDRIADACRRAGRSPDQVRLIAVTKEHAANVLPELMRAGIVDFGENRVEHLVSMHAEAPQGARFHAIGRLQSRQIPRLVPLAACIHSLCDGDHAARLDAEIAKLHRRMAVFLQVNVSGEASKAGVAPDALPRLLESVRSSSSLDAVGLMTMAPATATGANTGDIRRCFSALRELARRQNLERLSMGMSEDFEIAVEEGATDVRVGRRLFA